MIGWPLYKKYKHAYDAFKLCLQDQEDIFVGMDLDPKIKDDLISYIKRRLAPQPIKIRSDFEINCFTHEGIDAIKESLMKGIAVGTEKSPISIKLIAPPMYVMTTMTLEKDDGIALLERAVEVVRTAIEEKNGKMEVKMAPKAVSQREEQDLVAMMNKLLAEQEDEVE